MKCPECANRFNKHADKEYHNKGALASHIKYKHTNISESKRGALRRQNKNE